jgi:hypothetical protein
MRGFVTAGLLALLGCSGDGLDGLDGAWREGEGWRLEVVWQVGGAEAEGLTAFGDVRGVAVDASERAWVLDAMAKHLVVFGAEGDVVRTVGRQGGGPGEFNNLYGIGIDPDQRVWVPDPQNIRFTVFDTAGTLLSMHQRPGGGCFTYAWTGKVLTDGRVIDSFCTQVDGQTAWALGQYDTLVAAYRDTIDIPVARSEGDPLPFFEFSGSFIGIPFQPNSMWRLTTQGTVWTGWGGRYVIYQRALNGDTLAQITRPAALALVPPVQRDSAVARVRRFARGAEFDASRIPDTYPLFAGFDVSDDEHVWVYRQTADGMVWDVFDPAGRFLGEVAPPSGATLNPYLPAVIRGNDMWLVTTDRDGANMVVRLRIVK